ncbi:MAG: Futalosine hydrolase [Planctomycetota bacterium]
MPDTLLLVPTLPEQALLAPLLAARLAAPPPLELCGFGPVAAAARTAELLARRAPERVVLCGIAGGLDERVDVGAAYRFDQVACHGIGVGSAAGFVPAGELGWQQWPGDPAAATGQPAAGPIGDRIACGSRSGLAAAGLLLTVCAASASAEDAAQRRALFPEALAEDMEGYGVALACRLRGVSLTIIRGISNAAGDRNHLRWRVSEALAAAADLVRQDLGEPP